MSIDSSDYTSQGTNSSGNRAPPPPFSTQTFTQSRKRPALSKLGIEVSLASDVKTPNTPTPNFASEPLDSSDAVLKVRPTPTPPNDQQQNTYTQGYPESENNNYQHHHQTQQYQNHNENYSHNERYLHNNQYIRNEQYNRSDGIREPQLSIVLDALADFQHFYDQKSLKIENMVILITKIRLKFLGKSIETFK